MFVFCTGIARQTCGYISHGKRCTGYKSGQKIGHVLLLTCINTVKTLVYNKVQWFVKFLLYNIILSRKGKDGIHNLKNKKKLHSQKMSAKFARFSDTIIRGCLKFSQYAYN